MEADREQLTDELREHMRSVLNEAYPGFQKSFYESFLKKIEDEILRMFEAYASLSKKSRTYIQENYPGFERNLLVSFLSSLPNVTGTYTAADRDRMEDLLKDTFDISGMKLTEDDKNYLLNSFQEALRVYAGLLKSGDEKAEELYEQRADRILANLRASISRKKDEKADKGLRKQIDSTLESANLGIREYQKENIEDQILWLFRDYLNAPDEEKNEVYSRGEERIILSTFDPAGDRISISKGAK